MYLRRTLETYFLKAAKQFPVMLVTGARQVGKTTFLRHISEGKRRYVTLDDPLILRLAREDPGLFMQRFRPPVLIDEIQYAPELLPFIKMEVDENRRPGAFWLTGSQQFHLMKGVSESLAGRAGIVRLLGLSRRETEGRGTDVRPFLPIPGELGRRARTAAPLPLRRLYEVIHRGSFPGLVSSKKADWSLFYSSFVQTYLQRDLRDLARVGDETAFIRFLRAAAARSGMLLNLSDLARDADIAPNTAKSWLSILETSGIIHLLEPWHTNVTKRLVKTPKLYFLDTGLCSWLTGWTSPETLEAGAAAGPMLETWIVGELLKNRLHQGLNAPFFFYRDRDGKEIDLLIHEDEILYPLEFKKTASPDKNDIRHFSILEKLKAPIGPGGVICLIDQHLPLTQAISAIPISLL
ncbi:MAG TPA: ATP-binding protein [Candidatus Ozemobacteraceae bacterium]|nr:ATP-binding protein [Candidatus Ozemobacteraceae bacterium]